MEKGRGRGGSRGLLEGDGGKEEREGIWRAMAGGRWREIGLPEAVEEGGEKGSTRTWRGVGGRRKKGDRVFIKYI